MVLALPSQAISGFGLFDQVLGPASKFVSSAIVGCESSGLVLNDGVGSWAKYTDGGDAHRHGGQERPGQRVLEVRVPVEISGRYVRFR